MAVEKVYGPTRCCENYRTILFRNHYRGIHHLLYLKIYEFLSKTPIFVTSQKWYGQHAWPIFPRSGEKAATQPLTDLEDLKNCYKNGVFFFLLSNKH